MVLYGTAGYGGFWYGLAGMIWCGGVGWSWVWQGGV